MSNIGEERTGPDRTAGDGVRQSGDGSPVCAGGAIAGLQIAHEFAWDQRSDYGGRSFEDAEPELRRAWEAAGAPRPIEWETARAAVRDAWHCSR